ncbi:MAG: nucleotide exchange factor GrpE [Clostridia bacterium]|nr:nucleotide exchange factor GrpE [Clostridia bacterium]
MSKIKKKDKKTVNQQPEEIETPVMEDGAADAEVTGEENKAPERDLEKELEEAKKLSDEYLNMAQRVQADFDNFRRRNKDVRADSFEDGAREFIKTILPVMDNLERALDVESSDEKLHEGVAMVYRQLNDALEKRGVQAVSRLGEKFDPNLENAVMQGDESEGEPGTVCAVFQKGYRMGDAVLRHAMVKVVAG